MLWVRDASDGTQVQIYDARGTGLPESVNTLVLPHDLLEAVSRDGVVYCASRTGQIMVVDLDDPTAPVVHGIHDTGGGGFLELELHGDVLVAMQGGNVSTFALDCLGNPVSGADDSNVPRLFHLAVPVPNPFNPSTEMSFTLDRAQFVELAVYDVSGRKVRTLVAESKNVGIHTISWNGRGDSGEVMASGVYLARLKLAGATETRKMTLLK